MSQLDEIIAKPVEAVTESGYPTKEHNEAKQQIKDLMLELIGEPTAYSQPGMYEINVENKLRAKLRKEVDEL